MSIVLSIQTASFFDEESQASFVTIDQAPDRQESRTKEQGFHRPEPSGSSAVTISSR